MPLVVGRWEKEQTQGASPGSDTLEFVTEWIMRDTEKKKISKDYVKVKGGSDERRAGPSKDSG